MLSIFSVSRGPDGPDLPSPPGRKFQLSVQHKTSRPGMEDSDVDSEGSRRLIRVQSKSRFVLPYYWPNINWILA